MPRSRESSSRPSFELRRERVALLGHADDAGEHADHLQDLGDAALVEGEDRVAALDEVVGDVGLQIGEREDQIRLERLDLLVAGVQERRDLRLLTRLRRTHGVAGDADDTIALAEEVQRLGGFFGEADDAFREHEIRLRLRLSAKITEVVSGRQTQIRHGQRRRRSSR